MPYATTSSVRMYYEQAGEGVPLLFLSGTGWSGEYWKLEQVPYFSSSYRTIVFDYRGCGRSDKPEGRYSTRMFAHDAMALLDAIGVEEPAHVIGHSMGGRVAQWIALDHPDRIRSLVLAATGPGPIDERRRFVSPEFIAELVTLGWPGYHEAHLQGSNMFFKAPPEMVERFLTAFRGPFGTDVLSYLRHLDARFGHDTKDLLDRIVTPSLVIVGSEDNYSSPGHLETSQYLAEVLADVEFVLIPEVAHALQIETACEFNEAVATFLSRH